MIWRVIKGRCIIFVVKFGGKGGDVSYLFQNSRAAQLNDGLKCLIVIAYNEII